MTPDDIRHWRQTRFADFSGARNRRRIRRVQRTLLQGRLPSPLLLLGVYGYGKTSLARLMIKSLNCKNRNPKTADPCNTCSQCQFSGLYYNGYGYPYRRLEYDCTIPSRTEWIAELGQLIFEPETVMFLDEFHHIGDTLGQEPLLKFVEDYKGLFVAAIMEDRPEEVMPPLRERFEIIHLTAPTTDEMVEFFESKAPEWEIQATDDVLRFMVENTGKSFRISLKILAEAAEGDGILTIEMIRDILGMDDDQSSAA